MSEHDPFNDSPQHWVEEAKQPWTWPRAFAVVGRGLIFWTAVVLIVYLAVTEK